jgi:hypothetical protein
MVYAHIDKAFIPHYDSLLALEHQKVYADGVRCLWVWNYQHWVLLTGMLWIVGLLFCLWAIAEWFHAAQRYEPQRGGGAM